VKEVLSIYKQPAKLRRHFSDLFLAVPVRLKITGIVVLPVLILGIALVYWIQRGLSDWLSYLLTDERVQMAMDAGSRSVLILTIVVAVLVSGSGRKMKSDRSPKLST
jgi:hypothetical protein